MFNLCVSITKSINRFKSCNRVYIEPFDTRATGRINLGYLPLRNRWTQVVARFRRILRSARGLDSSVVRASRNNDGWARATTNPVNHYFVDLVSCSILLYIIYTLHDSYTYNYRIHILTLLYNKYYSINFLFKFFNVKSSLRVKGQSFPADINPCT